MSRPNDSAQKPLPDPLPLVKSEDWCAVWIGGSLLVTVLTCAWILGGGPEGRAGEFLSHYLAKPGEWTENPVGSLYRAGSHNPLAGLLGAFAVAFAAFTLAVALMTQEVRRFAAAFVGVFLLATLAYLLAGQEVVKHYNLEYAVWALAVALLISNTIGTPAWIKPAVRTELYIKTGLVLLGAEVLVNRLLALGVPGIFVAWVVTPTVLIGTFWFGQKVMRIRSPSLNMVISADMSVCGVSAAIATAAACKAKKEELSLAIGMSLTFTVVMMVLMPIVIKATAMSNVLGGAWMGGTIDATGAVAAAGAMLGEDALQVAATIKMIQNVLIGVVAFCVAVYWVVRVENESGASKPSAMEIWRRFPKFILGFIGASIAFSILYVTLSEGPAVVDATIKGTKTLRGWFFCLAFVSIGLDTNFRELGKHLRGGKPLLLYLVGQSFNLCLTLLMAWLMFEVVFPGAADVLRQ